MKYTIYVFVLFAFVFSSCSSLEEVSPTQAKVLKFESLESVNRYMNQSLEADYEGLVKLEDTQSFNSFGKKCDEIYQKAVDANFTSRAALEAFVEQHSEYLQFVTDIDGEVSLETRLYNSPLRYLINENRVYQLNNTAIKVFENGYVMTPMEKVDALDEFKGLRYQDAKRSSLTFVDIEGLNGTMQGARTMTSCDNRADGTATSGNERVRLEINTSHTPSTDPLVGGDNSIHRIFTKVHYKVRSQKRFLRIWFASQRKITAEINARVDLYSQTGVQTNALVYASTFEHFDSKWEGTLDGSFADVANNDQFSVFFGGYYAWAKTSSTSATLLSCNEDLACVNGCLAPIADPCEDVECLPGYSCVNGTCKLDAPLPCGGSCPPGYSCIGNTCVQNNE